MSPVRWTDQAVSDVQAIRGFIGRDSPRYGRIVAERLVEATLRLDTFPASGRIVPTLIARMSGNSSLASTASCIAFRPTSWFS